MSSSTRDSFLEFLRSETYTKFLYSQVSTVVNGRVFRKLVTIGDLKSCKAGVIYSSKGHVADRRLYTSADQFRSFLLKALYAVPRRVRASCGAVGFFAEVYATLMWFLDRGSSDSMSWGVIKDVEDFRDVVLVPVAYDFIVDLDISENPWIFEDRGLNELYFFVNMIVDMLGLEPTILVSRGIQLRTTLLQAHLAYYNVLGDDRWPTIVMRKLPEFHRRVALKLAKEFSEKRGIKVTIDIQVYEPARITRLDLSLHAGIEGFSVPIKPKFLRNLTWDDIRRLQKDLGFIRKLAKSSSGTWGSILSPKKYSRILDFFLTLDAFKENVRLDIEVKPENFKRFSLSVAEWRKIEDPTLGEIEYSSRLEGYGWVEVLVKERIPIHDGRLAFCWAILPPAIKGPKTGNGRLPPLVTREEVVEWLRHCIEKYPDKEKSLDDYIEKLAYNLRYGEVYNIPTWKSLISSKSKLGEPLSAVYTHIKYPVIMALHEVGYIKLTNEQMEKLKINCSGTTPSNPGS